MLNNLVKQIQSYFEPLIDMYKKRDINKIIQWLEKQYNERIAIRNLPPWAENMLGVGIGSWLGKKINNIYDSCLAKEKKLWEKNRWMHHGAIGHLIDWWGKLNANSFFIGLGTGLKQSDIQDQDKWFDTNFNSAFIELKQIAIERQSKR